MRWLPSTPEDFRVDELPLYDASGEGGHTFVRVEKRERTTEQVARDLARAAGVAAREVGYAGRKDRLAVATQWFSVPGLECAAALRLALPGARVLEAAAHPHKLRTGHLRGNRFRILVRDVAASACRESERRLGPPPRDRRAARFALSALQAEVFNVLLADRADALDRIERGDVAVVHRSGGLFVVEDPLREAPRAEAFEISATGPIFGTRVRQPTGAVAARERAALEARGIDLEKLHPPRGVRLRGARRALRVRPEAVGVERVREGLRLDFTLPPGSYATVLVAELLDDPDGSDDIAPRAGVS